MPRFQPPADDNKIKGTSSKAIAQDITAAILERRLPPGTWLREEALGRAYAVSRTKIRSALLMVSRDRLIEFIHGKGAFVCRPDIQEAREVFAVRRLLESDVVRLFMARAGEADYQTLERHIQFERSVLTSETRTSDAIREKLLGGFHVLLAETAGNRTLAELVREMVARCSLIAMYYPSSNDSQCSSDEHADFLRICRTGAVDEAIHSMQMHLLRIEANLTLEEESPPDQPCDLIKALLM